MDFANHIRGVKASKAYRDDPERADENGDIDKDGVLLFQ